MNIKFYNTINKNIETQIIEKKSKFIANIFYTESAQETEKIIKKIKKKYHDAKHHCFAYRIIEDKNIIERFSDDGEPSGTAGAPILSIIQKYNLCNVIIIVTRYFGGILLGTGGLVRAYTESVLNVIQKSEIVENIEGYNIELVIEYSDLELFKYYCKNNEINIINIQYKENVILKVEMEKNRKQKFEMDIKDKKIEIKQIIDIKSKFIYKNVVKNN